MLVRRKNRACQTLATPTHEGTAGELRWESKFPRRAGVCRSAPGFAGPRECRKYTSAGPVLAVSGDMAQSRPAVIGALFVAAVGLTFATPSLWASPRAAAVCCGASSDCPSSAPRCCDPWLLGKEPCDSESEGWCQSICLPNEQ